MNEYTYSIAGDTANALLFSPKLTNEIKVSNIAKELDRVDTLDDQISVWFLTPLDATEQTTLTALVAAHDGQPYPTNQEAQIVEFQSKPVVAVDKGDENFDTLISHNWIDNSTWPAVNDSCWCVEPSAADKQLIVPKAEVQFTHDVKMSTATTPSQLHFDVWAYNPLVDLGSPIDPDDPAFVPGVSSGNPLRFLAKRNTFKSLKDVFDFGNDHYTMPVAVDGLPDGVTTIRFDYDQKIVLRADQGMQIRFSLEGNNAMEGGANAFCTVSLVVREKDLD